MLVPDMPTRIFQDSLPSVNWLPWRALLTPYWMEHSIRNLTMFHSTSVNTRLLWTVLSSWLSAGYQYLSLLFCRTFLHSDSNSSPFRNITSINICQAGVLCQANSRQAITHWVSLATLMAASGLDWNINSRLYASNHQITSGWWCGLLPLTICCDQPVMFLTPALRCSCQQH